MTLAWWMIKKELYKQAIEVVNEYKGLRYKIENNKFIISGAWPVCDGSKGKIWVEDFLIKIVFPDNYPNDLPKVYETGNRIKTKNADTHFYPDGSACLFFPTERYLHFPKDKIFQLKHFLDIAVKSFFFSQLCYIYHKKWPVGDRSHNLKGLLEFYGEKLKIPNDEKNISTALSYLLKPQIKGHWSCPCGNNQLRKCHIENFRYLQNAIPKEIIRRDMNFLEKNPKKIIQHKKRGLKKHLRSIKF